MNKQFLRIFIMLMVCLSLFACGPSQADLDAQATQVMENYFATQTAAPTSTPTSTPIPSSTPTPTSTPTPIPGKFINPPGDLETVYYSDWFWSYNYATRIGFKWGEKNKYNSSLYYEGYDVIGFVMIFNEPIDDERQLFNDFLTSMLKNYVSTTAQEQIIRFADTNTDLGTYMAVIESFMVTFSTKMTDGKEVLSIKVSQTW